jgi:hypothetical protein
LNLAIAKLAKLIEENELIAATAFNDLNNNMNAMENRIMQNTKNYVNTSLEWINV